MSHRRSKSVLSAFLYPLGIISFFLFAAPQGVVAAKAVPHEEVQTFPASEEERRIVLYIPAPGRYSVQVKSGQGASLQLVQRATGPTQPSGVAGKSDGRVDRFFERGEVLAVVRGAKEATGDVELSLRGFEEKQETAPLPRAEWYSATLDDLKSITWRLIVPYAQTVNIEAGGRNLANLSLWEAGGWLVDARSDARIAEPTVGRPHRVFTISTRLEPGEYKITAYGGAALKWADDDGSHPLHVRFGLPNYIREDRRTAKVGPLGVERFVTSMIHNYLRLELPEAGEATLSSAQVSEDQNPYIASGQSRYIYKQTTPPVAELRTSIRSPNKQLVTISGKAGQPYTIQYFKLRNSYHLNDSGSFWVSTIQSGAPGDDFDQTMIAYYNNSSYKQLPQSTGAIPLTRSKGWMQRANLLGETTLHLKVEETGDYLVNISGKGTEVEHRIVPFFASYPRNFEFPDYELDNGKWSLNKGMYVLELRPRKRGVVTVMINTEGAYLPEKEPTRISAMLGETYVEWGKRLTVEVNQRHDVKTGLVVRPWPIPLEDSLPLGLRPGEPVELKVRLSTPGTISLADESGEERGRVLRDGAPLSSGKALRPGVHILTVENTGASSGWFNLSHESATKRAKGLVMPNGLAGLSGMVNSQRLVPDTPLNLDITRKEEKGLAMEVAGDGLYRIYTTGLLDTRGRVRSRYVPNLFSSSTGGNGRNFLLQNYLGSGDYRLSLNANGRSQGRLGLKLEATPLRDLGNLPFERQGRERLEAGEALSYTLKIEEKGLYRIEALALGRTLKCRLEDSEGWPVTTPGTRADMRLELSPGSYRLILLPEPLSVRTVTRVRKKMEGAQKYEGKGPFELLLGTQVRKVWHEPVEGDERAPDLWSFSLAASAMTTLTLTDEMKGDLYLIKGGGRKLVKTVEAYRERSGTFKGELQRGEYLLEVLNKRENDGAPYTVKLLTDELLPGQSAEVALRGERAISVDGDEVVEITSFGVHDVRATLLKGKEVVARSDDAPDDWNFMIVKRLERGKYTLRLEPVGSTMHLAGGREPYAQITVETREEKASPSLRAGKSITIPVSKEIYLIPLEGIEQGKISHFSASSPEKLGLALEARTDESWQTLTQRTGSSVAIMVPTTSSQLRLRLWSLDRRGSEAQVSFEIFEPEVVGESALADGLTLGEGSVVSVPLDGPGTFKLEGYRAGKLLVSTGEGTPLERSTGLAFSEKVLYLGATPSAGEPLEISGERVLLGNSPTQVPVPALVNFQGTPESHALLFAMGRGCAPAISAPHGEGYLPNNATPERAIAVLPVKGGLVELSENVALACGQVELYTRAFSPEGLDKLGSGLTEASLKEGKAFAYELGEGSKELRLSLSDGVTALLLKGDQPLSLHGDADARVSEQLTTSADKLVLYNAGKTDSSYELHLGAAVSQAKLVAGEYLQRRLTGPVAYVIEIAPGAGKIHSGGTDGPPLFVSSTGRSVYGVTIEALGEGGYLRLPVSAGSTLIKVALSEDGLRERALWEVAADAGEPEARRVTLPYSEGVEAEALKLSMDVATPSLLRLRSGGALMSKIENSCGERYSVEGEGLTHFFTPAGESLLTLKSRDGGRLTDKIELDLLTPVTLREGLGPETLLGGSEAKLFTFNVVEDTTQVGLGVKSDRGGVDTSLYDSMGMVLGSGAVQLHLLDKGIYYLELTASPGEGTVLARPAVVGLDKPDTGPPEQVLKGYLGEVGR